MANIGLGGTLSVKMAFTYTALAIVVLSTNTLVTTSTANTTSDTTPLIKPMLDPKRRNELIDEAFLEQKDMLLDMLEAKLKEVRDKKNKENIAENNNETDSNCESMPKNVGVELKAHGISAIGDTDIQLKYGEDGNGTLSLDATGISNVGKVHLKLGVVDGNVHIPGLKDVFTGEKLLTKKCHEVNSTGVNYTSNISRTKPEPDFDDVETRRVDGGEEKLNMTLPVNETSNFVDKSDNNVIHDSDNNIINSNNNNFSTVDSSTSITNGSTIVIEETTNATELVNDTSTLASTTV